MKKKVAFICVHNSCRSQIAEALANTLSVINMIFTLPELKQSRKSIRTLSGL